MNTYINLTSLVENEEDNLFNENDTLACFEPIELTEHVYESIVCEEEEKVSTNFAEEKIEEKTDIHINPFPVALSMLVKEYETWEGRVISTDIDVIKARIVNTQRLYSPRILQIKKAFMLSKGISKPLTIGDMFELTFKHVNIEFETKEKEIRQKEKFIDSIRLIEQVKMTRREIEDFVSKELENLRFLFE